MFAVFSTRRIFAPRRLFAWGAALALLTLGAGQARAETPEQQCARLVQAEISWNRAGARQWNPQNVRALCKGTQAPFATIACFNKGVRNHDDWSRAIDDCTGRKGAGNAPPPAAGFSGHSRIENRWRANMVIHVERGGVEAGAAAPGWHSARWAIEPVPGTPYVRFRNMWKPDQYLNIERGPLVAGPIQPGWHSAQWRIEPAPGGFSRIRNRWQSERALHVEHGRLEAGRIEPGWWSAMWTIR